ncbi:zinc finger RNA-binding protein-like [Impatiens glandulifera]|uniref:zinc finger RNA-binding protein-like n=1 Tax=Impatiens glandulifera TaxID=253017 RepID=UPI001FB14A24|nr:zinc finger RNA-binding protein-like [Impatiens glandulifera]
MDTTPVLLKKKEEMSNPVDLSSLPEEERQQLQKLQERFKEHQQQQQQQQQVANHPSQVQIQPPYDQQYQPYYGYYPYQPPPAQSSLQHPPFPPDHQHYYHDHRLQPQQQQYYHTENTNAYHQPDPHPQQHPPQIVPISHPQSQPMPPPAGQIQVHHQHNVYYPQNGRGDGDQQQSGPLNPAAAAAVSALSQLMQFAGTMGDAERALTMIGLQASGIAGYGRPLHQDPESFLPMAGQSMYMGGDIRGGGLSFPNNPEGRIRQRIGKGKIGPKLPYFPSSMPEPTAANKLQTPAAWCDLCKVECTSLEILKQHKNGKKHMKNLEKSGTSSSSAVVQNNQNNTSTTPVVIDSNAQPQVNVENSNNTVAGQKRESNHKTKAAAGGAKRAKLSDMHNRAFENPRPKVVVPLLCGLCNIKCDTQEVLNKHLSGKKHISKLRRYEPQHHQMAYEQTGIQSLYHLNAPIGVPPHHPLHFPQVHQPQSYYPPLLPAAAHHGIVPFAEGNHHNHQTG